MVGMIVIEKGKTKEWQVGFKRDIEWAVYKLATAIMRNSPEKETLLLSEVYIENS